MKWLDKLENLLKPSKPLTSEEDFVDSLILYAILAVLIMSLL